MNAPTPILFTGNDNIERRYGLTNKAFLEIARRAAKGATNGHVDFLWFSCLDRNGLTEDDFIEILPVADYDILVALTGRINDEWAGRNKSSEKNAHLRPTIAETQPSTGSGSSDSGAQT